MSAAVVYRMRDADDALLYVGCSACLPTRLQQHARTQGWWPSVARVEIQHFADLDNALAAEKEAIASESPLHNVQHKNLTADQIASRQASRAARRDEATRQKARWAFERKWWVPEDGEVIRCGNCGRQPDKFPKGNQLSEISCKRCGVEAFERQAA